MNILFAGCFGDQKKFAVYPKTGSQSRWDRLNARCHMDLSSNQIFQKKFYVKEKETLSIGSRSEVLRVKALGVRCALKKPNCRYSNFIPSEAKMLKSVNEQEKSENKEYFVQLIGLINRNNQSMMLMKLCEGGDLYKRVKNSAGGIGLESTITITQQMMKALGFLKENKIIHRNINLSSILIENGDQVRLGDFSLAMRKDDENERLIFCGTLSDLSPELFLANSRQESPRRYPYGTSSDVWATALSMLKALNRLDLFESTQSESETWEEQKKNIQYKHQELPAILKQEKQKLEQSQELERYYTALEKMLELEPRNRATPEAVLAFLDQKETSLLSQEEDLCPSTEKELPSLSNTLEFQRRLLLLDLDYAQQVSEEEDTSGNQELDLYNQEDDWDFTNLYNDQEEMEIGVSGDAFSTKENLAWASLCRRNGFEVDVLARAERFWSENHSLRSR